VEAVVRPGLLTPRRACVPRAVLSSAGSRGRRPEAGGPKKRRCCSRSANDISPCQWFESQTSRWMETQEEGGATHVVEGTMPGEEGGGGRRRWGKKEVGEEGGGGRRRWGKKEVPHT